MVVALTGGTRGSSYSGCVAFFSRVLRYNVFVLADRAVHGKGIGACVERACFDFAAS